MFSPTPSSSAVRSHSASASSSAASTENSFGASSIARLQRETSCLDGSRRIPLRSSTAGGSVCAARKRPDPRNQLVEGERLCHVVVRAECQAGNEVVDSP